MTQHDPEKSKEENEYEDTGGADSQRKKDRDRQKKNGKDQDKEKKATRLSEERTRLSKERTQLSKERVQLSIERTFTAWLRTGIASELAGIAIARFIAFTQYPTLPRVIGIIFILAGIAFYGISLSIYYNEYKTREETGFPLPSARVMFAVIIGLLLSAGMSLYLAIF